MAENNATLSQNRASEPMASTWLSANAGSGKTKVLTDRVARLLLSGVSPQNILCLTYTKAAASEMQNRLFKLLGTWAMKEDAPLRENLAELGENPDRDLNDARRLFARAIETPGGLKIQTIHSFCAALLRNFPLEAGVSPQFQEMDDRASLILREEALEAMAMGQGASVLAGLAAYYSGQDLDDLTKSISFKRSHFRQNSSQGDIWSWFDLPSEYDDATLLDTVFRSTDADMLARLSVVLKQGSSTDQKAAATLASLGKDLTVNSLAQLEGVFLSKSGETPFAAKIGKFPTKGTQKGAGAEFMPELELLMLRVEAGRPHRMGLHAAQKTQVLHRFARPFLEEYEARKLQRGWLDFDDLIEKAGDLLSDPSLAAWVLYRLDGGIDHILVDEAQDTSPAQWKVIKLLAQEFTSGQGAHEGARTIFVVGDPKQSIYSFQGAEPAEFLKMKEHFSTQLAGIGKRLESRKLEYSFRSSTAILGLADFALLDRPGLGDHFRHIAFFNKKPGRVDLWPAIDPVEYKEERDWTDTTDIELPQTHIIQLGRAVAGEVERLISQESLQNKDREFKAVQPKDILILVRKRTGGLFDEIIRACKERELPIAGADQMRIGAELAVKDLTALLRFLATPEDNLSLAAALRSPLFGFSEQALYALAQPRPDGAYLWAALRAQTDVHPECIAALTSLRDASDYLRPYELMENILTQHKGRENLLARLGREAEDGIDALLGQTLAYEMAQTPSLTGFLEWLDALDVKIKRQIDSTSNQIRVMTVHGAKGLEAPIVILPDTAITRAKPAPDLLETSDGKLAWKPLSADMPATLKDAESAGKAAIAEETARLLYVATTRAESWLIIAAAGKVGEKCDSWYSILEQGLELLGPVPFASPVGEGLRYETGEWPALRTKTTVAKNKLSPLPDWARAPSDPPETMAPPLSPSDLGGAKALTGEANILDTEDAKKRGRQLHLLLEKLPGHPADLWPELSEKLLAQGEDAASPAQARLMCGEVAALINDPNLAHVFASGTLAEVDISAALGDQQMQGTIDRLIVSPERIVVVDFKSNAIVPKQAGDVPAGILRQMGAYAQALAQIFPQTPVECQILWTTNGNLMAIPPGLAAASLSLP